MHGPDADQVGVGRDLAEALGPVVTAPSEDLDAAVDDVELGAVAVVLDLVQPAVPARDPLDHLGEKRVDEAGIRCLLADRRGLLTLRRH